MTVLCATFCENISGNPKLFIKQIMFSYIIISYTLPFNSITQNKVNNPADATNRQMEVTEAQAGRHTPTPKKGKGGGRNFP